MNFNSINTDRLLEWKRKNNLKKSVYRCILDAYRRAHEFHNGNYRYNLLVLALPSQAKQAITEGYLRPCGKEINRASNWYSLTDKGVALVSTLEPVIGEWDKDKNFVLFMTI